MSASPVFELTGELPVGRVAIEASAGTGKTFTLAGLVTRYVAEEGIPISELLVVTFTRAAAAELRDRVRTRLVETAAALRCEDAGAADDRLVALLGATAREEHRRRLEQAVADFDAATITTIHGFAQQALTMLGAAAPGDPDATLVTDSSELVAEATADVLAGASVEEPGRVEELPSAQILESVALKALENPGIVLVPGTDPAESSPKAASWRRLVDRVVDEVRRRRRLAGTISFDDLLTQLHDAVRTGDAATAMLRQRFRVALVDEFQDTDPVQWGIFSALFGEPGTGTTLVLVGDPKQAIYAFRGADVHTYLEAARAPGTGHFTLGTNWRSDGALLEALERLLDGATFGDDEIGFVPVEAAAGHTGRRITTEAGAPLPALVVRAALDGELERTKNGLIETPTVEAAIGRDLAHYVQDLLETAWLPPSEKNPERRPARPGDLAVLVGTHHEASLVQQELRRRAIPAVVARGGSVLDSAAADQWRWLLTGLARPADPTRARTAALSWFFGWSVVQLEAAGDDGLASVQEQLHEWADDLESHGVVTFCARLWADSGVAAHVLGLRDGDRDVTDLEHLAGLLQATATGRHPTAATLLASFDELGPSRSVDGDDVTARRVESEAEAVQVMTVYAAKGLEFPIVCVPTLWRRSHATAREIVYQDPITGDRSFDVASSEPWPDKRSSAGRKQLADEEALGENLRLLYVALTRAAHQTVVWWTRAQGSDVTGLARVLFGRSETGIDPARFAGRKVALPPDADAVGMLDAALGDGDALAIRETGLARRTRDRWSPPPDPLPDRSLGVATLGRDLDRAHRRWSFSSIVGPFRSLDLDPGDDSLGDAGAADEAVGPPDPDLLEAGAAQAGAGAVQAGQEEGGAERAGGAGREGGTDLPLGAVPGGAELGTLVHAVLEQVDFAAADLDGELAVAIEEQMRWSSWPVAPDELRAGLRAVIETPLGGQFGGRRLADIQRADRLDELSFELRLGESGRRATDRDIGALLLGHLDGSDPLRGWAGRLAAGLFDVELAGHLTGSIDAVFRLGDESRPGAAPSFVLADYKTNTLGERGRQPRSSDYHPRRLPAAMAEHHYPLQALLYLVALHRYLRWRIPGYDPAANLGGAAYLFVRGMSGPGTPTVEGEPHGVFTWRLAPLLVTELSDLLDGRLATREASR